MLEYNPSAIKLLEKMKNKNWSALSSNPAIFEIDITPIKKMFS